MGLALVMGVAYFYLTGGANPLAAGSEKERPQQMLDNTRKAAKRIEDDAQKRADDLMRRTAVQ
jgi:hypothetical protein